MREGEHQLPSESAGNPAESTGAGAGKDEASAKLKCPACGFLNEPEAESCTRCGQRLKAREASELASPWGEEPFRAEPEERTPAGGGQEPVGRETPPREEERRLSAPPEAGAERAPQAHEPAKEGEQPPSEESVRYSFVPSADRERAMVLPAGLGRRTVALLIDLILVLLLSSLLLVLTGSEWVVADYQARMLSGEQGLLGVGSLPAEIATAWNYLSIAIFVMVVGYFGIFSGYGGQTLGKAAMGIRLMHRDGREVSLWVGLFRALVLWLAIDLTFGFYLLFAGFMVLLDREGRSIHDLFFATNVFAIPRAQH